MMFILGGSVKAAKFTASGRHGYRQLYQNRDLAITTDFRQVLGVAYKTLGVRNLDFVFPDRN